MRVVQFVTLFLALAVMCGCSHRRAQQQPVTTSFCECSTCRCDQERLIREGAIPAGHFQNSEAFQTSEPIATVAPLAAPLRTNDFAPEYASEPVVGAPSPYSSGNPIEMDGKVPQAFDVPQVDNIQDNTQVPPSTPAKELKLEWPSSTPVTPPDQIPSELVPDGAFKPFNREVFKVEANAEAKLPQDEKPSTLIDKLSMTNEPELNSFVPPLKEPDTTDFQLLNSFVQNHLSLEQEQPEIVEPDETVAETIQQDLNEFEPPAEMVLLAPKELVPVAQALAPVPQPIRQTETIVEGELYEDPIVLYARQRRDVLTASAVQKPGVVRPASVRKPVKHQSIVQDSEFDPVYGLPLSNNVQFNSLPTIQQPPVTPLVATQAAPSTEAQHLHVHIHHDYRNPAAGQVRYSDQTRQQAANVQVVYRDDEGRVIMAPPTPTGSINSAEPNGDQRTYYVPPEQILRLKATSPIDRPRSKPSVATIQMRDSVIHGGTHLLASPEYQAMPVLTEHGLPGINYDKLREAFKTSPNDNPLR